MPPACIQDGPGRVQVPGDTEIKILLGSGADHGGEVKDTVGIGGDRFFQLHAIGDVTGQHPHPGILGQFR